MLIELKVPDIGDFEQVEVIEVMISSGDTVSLDQDIITLESDKAAMEIPASHAGVIKEVKVSEGDKISIDDVIALLEVADDVQSVDEAPKKETEIIVASQTAPIPAKQDTPVTKPNESSITDVMPYAPSVDTGSKNAHASPSVRKFARELGVNINRVKGSGVKGRLIKEDVQGFVKQKLNAVPATGGIGSAIPPIPVVDFAKFGKIETVELSRIKKIAGKHLHACWLNIPHVTQFGDADITELEEFRKANKADATNKGVSLTPLVFIMKAAAATLRLYPNFNSSLSEDATSLIMKNYYNIGVAVDTPNGLVVPVIKDVDKKGFIELAGELGDISSRARDGALKAKELQGGTFSISSLGGIGGSHFTPIVNAPEVAILGVGRHQMEPVWNGEEFIPRLKLPLSLSYDHRVVDGAGGARFITHLGQMLSDIRKVLL